MAPPPRRTLRRTAATRRRSPGKAFDGASDSAFAFAVPPGRLVVVALVGLAAGDRAGLRPARRAARLDVLRAIATE
ncbi:hypothetical protein OOK36_39955 [Streptomyces sp. NBC_00365]|uniref:hypothetical protein n=1 Tax=Streptomyces sp. NBC_00365 TaxID=2975726 RepID=UPI002256427A|nr:hypothetical protein [Streptomyces sp. NBC_00365]MCX5094921.1 hypothetical protein [Streptomyces sp. NBC_00365]